MEELAKRGFIECQNEPREREDFAGLKNHAVAIDRDDFGIQPDFLRGEERGDGLGKGLDAASGNPSASGGKFFQVVTEQCGAGRKVVVEQGATEKRLREAGEEFGGKSTALEKFPRGEVVRRGAVGHRHRHRAARP